MFPWALLLLFPLLLLQRGCDPHVSNEDNHINCVAFEDGVLSEIPTTTRAMAQTDIEDTVTAATGTAATSNANFIQTTPGSPKICAGRRCAGVLGSGVTVLVD